MARCIRRECPDLSNGYTMTTPNSWDASPFALVSFQVTHLCSASQDIQSLNDPGYWRLQVPVTLFETYRKLKLRRNFRFFGYVGRNLSDVLAFAFTVVNLGTFSCCHRDINRCHKNQFLFQKNCFLLLLLMYTFFLCSAPLFCIS